MSNQADIETAIASKLETSIVGHGNVYLGSISQPRVEGNERYASVRGTAGRARRLLFGQLDWVESYAVTIWWARSVTRSTAIDEWEAFEDLLRADQYLGLSGVVRDSYLEAKQWYDPEGQWLTMSASIDVSRIE